MVVAGLQPQTTPRSFILVQGATLPCFGEKGCNGSLFPFWTPPCINVLQYTIDHCRTIGKVVLMTGSNTMIWWLELFS